MHQRQMDQLHPASIFNMQLWWCPGYGKHGAGNDLVDLQLDVSHLLLGIPDRILVCLFLSILNNSRFSINTKFGK